MNDEDKVRVDQAARAVANMAAAIRGMETFATVAAVAFRTVRDTVRSCNQMRDVMRGSPDVRRTLEWQNEVNANPPRRR